MVKAIFLSMLSFLIVSGTAYSASFTFAEAASRISEQSLGLITLNPERSSVTTLEIDHQKMIPLEDLRLILDEKNNTFVPVQDVKIDAFNELMVLNWKRFEEMKGQLPIYPKLSTWMELPYPPLRKVPFEVKVAHTSEAFQSSTFHQNVDRLTGTQLTSGNQLRLLQNGESFQEKMRMLREAKHFFWGSSLLFSCGTATDPMVELMIQRKKEGIDVRLMVDATMDRFGHFACTEKLKKAGIEVIRAKGFFLKGSAFHMKIWVRDGEEALVDGANMIDSEVLSTGYNQLYRDTAIWVKGPSSTDLTEEFLKLLKAYAHHPSELLLALGKITELKKSESEHGLRDVSHYDSWLRGNQGVCRVVTQSKASEYDRISKTFNAYIHQAKLSLYASTVATDFLKASNKSSRWNHIILNDFIDQSKLPGFNAEILMNEKLHSFSPYTLPGSGLNGDAHSNIFSRYFLWKKNHAVPGIISDMNEFGEKLKVDGSNLQVYSHFQFIHSKLLFLDESVLSVGSYNIFYKRSNRDAEVTILCQDEALNQEFKRVKTLDMLNSVPVH